MCKLLRVCEKKSSALDSGTEHAIMDSIREVSRDRTSLIIAHRLSTIVDAHRIVMLDKSGRVAETGTHNELLAKRGAYYAAWMQQQQAEVEVAELQNSSKESD